MVSQSHTSIKGYQFLDFDPKKSSLTGVKEMQQRDMCASLSKALNDERIAAVEYKGMTLHYDGILLPDEIHTLSEIAIDETDHRAKLEAIFDNHCL